ncbi:DnaJ domain-containing protein [Helicobacter pylori]
MYNGSDLEKYYKILKCSPTDSLDTIKKAYRKLAIPPRQDSV